MFAATLGQPVWESAPPRPLSEVVDPRAIKLATMGLLALLVTSIAIHALTPVEAAAPISFPASGGAVPGTLLDAWPPGGVWPPPQEPLDTTPITPFETVGGLPYEP